MCNLLICENFSSLILICYFFVAVIFHGFFQKFQQKEPRISCASNVIDDRESFVITVTLNSNLRLFLTVD